MNLTYRSNARVEDLQPGECTIHRASMGNGPSWWLLWWYVEREDAPGVLEDFAVAVNPRGPYVEQGPGGRTWGLTQSGPGVWQIAPSINVLADEKRVVAGAHPSPSRWHQTPALVGIPDGEPWQ